ncbi:MAG: glycosyltransferase [Planctomycetaceae bacterium]|jgi:glycosyltransferase involved in cell wall biosynthesis|nr:glycosyltransferase [Planctomycetaceae bacterium]
MNLLLFMGNGNVIDSAGGAEKVLCNMANEMTLRGSHVTILCNDTKQGLPFYPLLPEVKLINLGGIGKNKRYPQIKKIIREITRPMRKTFLYPFFSDPIEKLKLQELTPAIRETMERIEPDVIISYFVEDHYAITHSIKDQQYPLLLMHHNSPKTDLLKLPRHKILSLKKCDCLQLLLPSFENQVNQILPWLKTATIPNIVSSVADNCVANLFRHKNEYTIVMAARLDPKQKQQHFLIRSFSKIARDYPHWKVKFYGGECTRNYSQFLIELIKKHRLENQVFLMGTTKQPLDVLRESGVFAFPTAFEGFPLALTEAMSVGLPCVGLKTASAVNELIVDGYNGFLSENNESDFAAKLKILMDNPQLRAAMGKNGHEFVKQFEPKKIWDQWENLIDETVEQHKSKHENFISKAKKYAA